MSQFSNNVNIEMRMCFLLGDCLELVACKLPPVTWPYVSPLPQLLPRKRKKITKTSHKMYTLLNLLSLAARLSWYSREVSESYMGAASLVSRYRLGTRAKLSGFLLMGGVNVIVACKMTDTII